MPMKVPLNNSYNFVLRVNIAHEKKMEKSPKCKGQENCSKIPKCKGQGNCSKIPKCKEQGNCSKIPKCKGQGYCNKSPTYRGTKRVRPRSKDRVSDTYMKRQAQVKG